MTAFQLDISRLGLYEIQTQGGSEKTSLNDESSTVDANLDEGLNEGGLTMEARTYTQYLRDENPSIETIARELVHGWRDINNPENYMVKYPLLGSVGVGIYFGKVEPCW